MIAGRVIVLNGTTSAGKSTLAKALQRRLATAGEPWIVIALDDFFARVPPDWFWIGDHVGPHAQDGMTFEMIDGAIERRMGPFGRTVLAAYRAAVAAMARAGLDVIVDEVLLSADDWQAWQIELDLRATLDDVADMLRLEEVVFGRPLLARPQEPTRRGTSSVRGGTGSNPFGAAQSLSRQACLRNGERRRRHALGDVRREVTEHVR